MPEKQTRKPHSRRERDAPEHDEEAQREEVSKKGDEIEERLDGLDEMIDEALGEDEEEAERRSQQFVDGFRQEGGQ